jgi:hypothetical protein
MTDMLAGFALLFRRARRGEEERAVIGRFLAALAALAHSRPAPRRRRARSKEIA